jgi:hypothetical protein
VFYTKYCFPMAIVSRIETAFCLHLSASKTK